MKLLWLLFLCVLALALPARADVNICATASCSGQTTTGTVSASSTGLAIAAAKDFVNGQGVRVDHVGASLTTLVPTGIGVASVGTTGSTSYLYQVSSVDGAGGVSAALAAGGISDGFNDLSPNNYNNITWSAPGSGPAPKGYAVWRNKDGAGYQFLKMTTGAGMWDFGTVDSRPSWVPATPPAADLPDWLVTTIASGGGSTSLTLAAAATNAGTGVQVLHDDTALLNTAIGALNGAGGGYNLTLPEGSNRLRTTGLVNPITVSNANLVAAPGAQYLPAGASSSGFGIYFTGASPSTSFTLAGDLAEGSVLVDFTSVAGLVADDMLVCTQEAPGGFSNSGIYWFASQVRSILNASTKTVTLSDPAPVSFAPNFQTITVGGTWLQGETITATFSGQTPASVTATVRNGFASPPDVAIDLAVAIENAFMAVNSKIFAWTNGDPTTPKIVVYAPSRLGTVTLGTSAVTASGTALAQSTYGAASCKKWVPISNVGVQNLTVDGTDFLGYGLVLEEVKDVTLKGIRLQNIHTGGGMSNFDFYNLVADDIAANAGASGTPNTSSFADMWFINGTILQLSNIRSRRSHSFGGPQVQAVAYYMGNNLYQSGAEAGRGMKTDAVSGFSIANVIANHSASTNAAFTYGTRRGVISGLIAMGGERNLISNGACLWFAGTFNQFLHFFGVHTEGCKKNDFELSVSDQHNTATGVTAGDHGFGSIYNKGLMRFFGLNGYNQGGGDTGATTFNFDGSGNGNNSPTVVQRLEGAITR